MLKKFFSSSITHKMSRRWITVIILLTVLITLSCSLTGSPDTGLQQTKIALEVQMTSLAQQSGQGSQMTAAAEQANQIAQDAQATLMAQQATQLAEQATQLAQGQSQTLSTEAPPIVTEQPPAANENLVNNAELEARIKGAKILLFEDLAGQKAMGIYPIRYVKEALDMGGYSYKDDGSAQGWFKDDLLASTKWDLIIVSSEARTGIQGEYFQYLQEQINRGAAVILEMWYLDDVVNGKIAPLISKCGVDLYADWATPDSLALWPLIPDHPLFNYPNSGVSLRKTAPFWDYEHGDLLKLTGSGDATLLLGTIATNKSDHGTLVSCYNGRVLIQTFCTHDYDRGNIEALWENYVYYVLKNKFASEP